MEDKRIKDCGEANDRLTEKSFMRSMTASVLGILMCIVLLSSATWAWFSEDITSSQNTISTAGCDITVKVEKSGTEVEGTAAADHVTYQFEDGVSYTVKLTATGTASTCYCMIKAGDKEYYTAQFPPNGSGITFTLTATEPVDVTIYERWGTHHTPVDQRDFYDGGTVTIPATNPAANPNP